MLFKPALGIGTDGTNLQILSPEPRHGGLHQLSRHALSPEGVIHKSAGDGRLSLPGGKQDLRQQLSILVLGPDTAGFFLEFHKNTSFSTFGS